MSTLSKAHREVLSLIADRTGGGTASLANTGTLTLAASWGTISEAAAYGVGGGAAKVKSFIDGLRGIGDAGAAISGGAQALGAVGEAAAGVVALDRLPVNLCRCSHGSRCLRSSASSSARRSVSYCCRP